MDEPLRKVEPKDQHAEEDEVTALKQKQDDLLRHKRSLFVRMVSNDKREEK